MLKKMITLTIIIAFTLTFLQNCDTTEPPSNKTISLTFEDASSTEVWLNLRTENISIPQQLNLLQNDTLRYSINLTSNDTTLYIDSLLPNQTYKFKSTVHLITQTTNQLFTSNILQAATMDTTSHNFTWETFTIGKNGILRDVAIIDENNIWAVGEIYLDDSTGGGGLHNAAHWDGNEWKILRIPTATYGGFIRNEILNTILAFSENEIWTFSSAGSYSHWDGYKWETKFVDERTGSGSRLWGNNSSNIYLVGTNGSISNYNGTTWQKIVSGTEVDLLDVWGTDDGEVVWICGYDSDYRKTILLRIEDMNVKKLYEGDSFGKNNDHYVGLFGGIYGKRDNLILMNTGHLFKQRNTSILNMKFVSDLTSWGYSIGGTEINNIFISGQNGLVGHFNGLTYHEYNELKNNQYFLYSLDVKKSITVIVGEQYLSPIEQKTIVIIGKK